MKKALNRKDSLFTAKARGGVIGASGYNYQDAFVALTVPLWLRDPAFQSIVKEGFDDVDVRFEDASGTWTWFYQLKDHAVNSSELRAVLARFEEISGNSELHARRFILGCTALAPGLSSLWRMVREYRGALQGHTKESLRPTRHDLDARIRRMSLGEWSDFIIEELVIDVDTLGSSDLDLPGLQERFRGRFMGMPHFRGEPPDVLDRLLVQLAFRINTSIRKGMTRAAIVAAIDEEVASATKGPATVVYLHGWARQQYDLPADIDVDWTNHFDHKTLRVPPPEIWNGQLIPELERLRDRLDGRGDQRRIWLRSRAPLSVGLAFGRTFAEAAGYSIAVQQPSPGVARGVQYWTTDSLADASGALAVSEVQGHLDGKEVAIGVGITDDIRPRVETYLAQARLSIRACLYLRPTTGQSPVSVDEGNAASVVAAIKHEIRRFADEHQAGLVHLFYYGPFGLAVLLGQKLNGLPDIQVYERSKLAGYTPTCRLPG